jgi:hypothetical protein
MNADLTYEMVEDKATPRDERRPLDLDGQTANPIREARGLV